MLAALLKFLKPVMDVCVALDSKLFTLLVLKSYFRGDFLRVLHALAANKQKFDYIVIETTGLADPTFTSVFDEEHLKKHFTLDGIIVR